MTDSLLSELAKDVREIRADVTEIKLQLATARGAWKMATVFGAVVGAIIAFVVKVLLK